MNSLSIVSSPNTLAGKILYLCTYTSYPLPVRILCNSLATDVKKYNCKRNCGYSDTIFVNQPSFEKYVSNKSNQCDTSAECCILSINFLLCTTEFHIHCELCGFYSIRAHKISERYNNPCYKLIHIDFFQSHSHLKDALQICASFRGQYLDTKDKADAINEKKLAEQSGTR